MSKGSKTEPKPGIEGIIAFSSDPQDKRVLRVHFDHDVTEADRAELLNAIGQFILEY